MSTLHLIDCTRERRVD